MVFWTAAAEADATIRVATVEYLLDYGHLLEDVTAALNTAPLAQGGANVIFPDLKEAMGHVQREVRDRLMRMMMGAGNSSAGSGT